MTGIIDALTTLNQSLQNLETAAAQQPKAPAGGQSDLFGVSIDPSVIARKLDITIERVEQMLREG